MKYARLSLSALCTAVLLPTYAAAQADAADVDALFEAMALPEILEIMQVEGLEYGAQIADDLFPDRSHDDWSQEVADIYALNTMTNTVRATLIDALDGAEMARITDFFEGPLGTEIIDLEVAARRALMDEDVEAASEEAAARALSEDTPRSQLLTAFIEANGLIESNIVGAMNANYAFYIGLLDGGGLPRSLSEEDILTDVWSQEAEIRQNTSEWVYSYLMLAYQPLSDDDLRDYIAFSQTDAGQDLNTALFQAFDGMFEGISGALGRAASSNMVGQDL